MADNKREHEAVETAAETPATVGGDRDQAQDRLIAQGRGDRDAYASILRQQPGAMSHGASALHARFGNAFAMQVMDEVGGNAERGSGERETEGYEATRGAPAPAAKVPGLADFEKDMAVMRDRYDARMRALAENGEEVQNNPGVVPGDPGVEYRLNDPIVSGNRLLADTKKKIDELEEAKSREKAGSATWNKLNKVQQDLLQWGGILWEEEYRYRELLKKRGFKAKNVEPFP